MDGQDRRHALINLERIADYLSKCFNAMSRAGRALRNDA
jgi:hypothetical protein